MAHFAQINEDNIVQQVIVVDNEKLKDNGLEVEAKGIAFCKNLLGEDKTWVQTSFNSKFRKQFAGKGFYYDAKKDKFISPQPYPSWSLDENDDWQAPSPHPKVEGKFYTWDEENKQWVQR